MEQREQILEKIQDLEEKNNSIELQPSASMQTSLTEKLPLTEKAHLVSNAAHRWRYSISTIPLPGPDHIMYSSRGSIKFVFTLLESNALICINDGCRSSEFAASATEL